MCSVGRGWRGKTQEEGHKNTQALANFNKHCSDYAAAALPLLNWQCVVSPAGASALDRKARRKFDAWQLQNVNATPEKPGRLSAAIGKGDLLPSLAGLDITHKWLILLSPIKSPRASLPGKLRLAPHAPSPGWHAL